MKKMLLLFLLLPALAGTAFNGAWVIGASDRWWKQSQFACFDATGKQTAFVTLAEKLGPKFPGSRLRCPNTASMDKDGRLWALVVVDAADPFKKVCDYWLACFAPDGTLALTVALARGKSPYLSYALSARTADGSVWVCEASAGILERYGADGKRLDSKQAPAYKGGKQLAAIPGTGAAWLGGPEINYDYHISRLTAPGTAVASFVRRYLSPERIVACADGGLWFIGYQNLGNFNVYHHLIHLDATGKIVWQDKTRSDNKLGNVLAGTADGGVWMKRMDKYDKYHLVHMDGMGEVKARVTGYTEGETLQIAPGGAVWFLGKLEGKWGLYRLDDQGRILQRCMVIPVKYQHAVVN